MMKETLEKCSEPIKLKIIDVLCHIDTVKSKQEKFPAKNQASVFDCFDLLHGWIEAADWLMVSKLNFFAGFLI